MAVNGQPVGQIADYTCAMLAMRAGQAVGFRIGRGGSEQAVEVLIAARPKPDGNALAAKLLGLTLCPVTPESAAELRLPTSSGLLVVGVEEGSPAGRMGVQLQDVLFQVNQFYVRDLDELGMALEPVRSGQGVMIGVARGNMRALAKIAAR
ncbi:MAG: PDZ domain-containing protein [Phycisphaerae bacterium]|nr:PDZ domain-containing protein [Phycisphaerae bacterium]